MFCGERFYAVGSLSAPKPYRFSPGDRTGFGPAFTLFEQFTGGMIDVPDLSTGNYVDLLDFEHYYTSFRGLVKRQRINWNLLGNLRFCAAISFRTLTSSCS